MAELKPSRSLGFGLGLVTGATLVLQTALTRLFSVIFLYHFALVAVSSAMFGMAVGAVLVHLWPRVFPQDQSQQRAADCASFMGLATVVGLLGCLYVPFELSTNALGIMGFLAWMLFVVTPFLFSGLTVCLCLTRFPQIVGKLYAFDLAGAALGCLLAAGLLNHVGPYNTVLLAAWLAAMGGVLMSTSTARRRLTGAVAALLGLVLVGNFFTHTLKIKYVLGRPYAPKDTRYELWNAFSYLFVSAPRDKMILWGPGDRFKPSLFKPEYMLLLMDTRAATRMIRFDGDYNAVSWLNWDVISLAHDLRPTGRVLVIGPGGGRDILAALIPAKGNRLVTGVEINPLTRHVVMDLEKDYNGLSKVPGVNYVNDEARSWLARDPNRYQVITVPLVDTWASTSAGAFALSENSLYTVEAFRLYLQHLEARGVLSVSRWWHAGSIGETHRLMILAAEALRQQGISQPRQHLILALGADVVNLLASPSPFTPEDEASLRQACEQRGYQVLLSPSHCADPRLENFLAHPEQASGWFGDVHLDLSPTTDNRPYFFHSFSLRNLFTGNLKTATGTTTSERDAMVILSSLVVAVTAVAVGFWVWPARACTGSQRAMLTYFACLGFGFMYFESAQLQRLNLFLGYPVYSITVVLFTLLLSSSLGSWWAEKRLRLNQFPTVKVALVLIGSLLLVNFLTLQALHSLAGATTAVRIVVAGLLMSMMGLPLGTMFPYGLQLAQKAEVSLAWCWALNGAASAAAAVYAIAFSLSYGIEFTYWLSVLSYLVAFALIWKPASRV
ncbi:hypothetical protein IV102_08370 [bacterium]|nr:hypothetical protein [bacterium]